MNGIAIHDTNVAMLKMPCNSSASVALVSPKNRLGQDRSLH